MILVTFAENSYKMIDLNIFDAVSQQQDNEQVQRSSLAQKVAKEAVQQQSSYRIPEEFQGIIDSINAEREQQLIQDRMNVFNNYVQQKACGGCIKHGSGGSIHIDPNKKGTFTAAASRHGMGVQAFASKVLANKENYSPAMVKKANFARNASKWHAQGGPLNSYGEGDVITISQLPREFVDANRTMMVRTPSGAAVPLSEAYSKWGGTHVNINDVPGLTDYLLTQPQIERQQELEDLQMFRQRDAAERNMAKDKALYDSALYAGGAALAKFIGTGGLALDEAQALGITLPELWGSVKGGVSQAFNNPLVFGQISRAIQGSKIPGKIKSAYDYIHDNVPQWIDTAKGWLPDDWFQAPGIPYGGGTFSGAGGGSSWGDEPYRLLKPGTSLESMPLIGPIVGNPAEMMRQYSKGGYIEDGLRARGVTGFRVTSGYRGPNSKVGHAGKRSGHARYLGDGKSSGAIDIVPTDKSPEGWARLEQQLRRPDVEEFIRGEIGGTILAETDPATMRKTGATGPHYHIGLGVAGDGNFYGHSHSTVPRSASSRVSWSSMPAIPFSPPEPMMAMAPMQEEPVQPEAPWWGSYLSTPQQATPSVSTSPFGEDYSFLDLAWNPMTGANEPTTTHSSFPNLFPWGGYLAPNFSAQRGTGVLKSSANDLVAGLYQTIKAAKQQEKERKQGRRVPKGTGALRDDKVKNKEAILQHKVANGVTAPYVIVDKQNNRMDVYSGDKLLESHEVGLGGIEGDGRYQLQTGEQLQYWKMPRTTPAGIFTTYPVSTSPYYNEPMFLLLDNGRGTNVSIHAPAGPDRVAVLNNGNPADNRVSYGCVSPGLGVVEHLYKDKVLGKGDTVYVLPETPGNYIARQGNHLMTVFGGHNPSTFVSPSGFNGPVTYNTSQ